MGKLIEALKKGGRTTPKPTGPAHNHSADYLYQKHLADQGLGPAPTDTPVPATGPTTPAAPPGGIVDQPANFGDAMHNVIAKKKGVPSIGI